MSERIVQLNEEVIKSQIKELVRDSVMSAQRPAKATKMATISAA